MQAQQQLTQAEARAESAEQAKIELSLKLADVVAQRDSAGDVSGMPSKKEPEGSEDADTLQKRYTHLHCVSWYLPTSWSHHPHPFDYLHQFDHDCPATSSNLCMPSRQLYAV